MKNGTVMNIKRNFPYVLVLLMTILYLSFFTRIDNVFHLDSSSEKLVIAKGLSQDVVHIAYVVTGPLQQHQVLSLLYAALTQFNAAIHLVYLDPPVSTSDYWTSLQALGVEVIPIQSNNSSLYRQLKSQYFHGSVNTPEYEFFCFVRHLILHEVVANRGYSSILSLDSDVVLFRNVSEVSKPGTTISHRGTYYIHWTAEALEEFSKYTLNFYSKDPVEIATAIAKHGTPHAAAAGSQYYDVRWPPEIERMQFSDMHLFTVFLESSTSIQTIYEIGKTPKEVEPINNLQFAMGPSFQNCMSGNLVYNHFTWDKDDRLRPFLDGAPVPGMHFAGNCKSSMAFLLCPSIVAIANGLEFGPLLRYAGCAIKI